jgi:hypothetical protein
MKRAHYQTASDVICSQLPVDTDVLPTILFSDTLNVLT